MLPTASWSFPGHVVSSTARYQIPPDTRDFFGKNTGFYPIGSMYAIYGNMDPIFYHQYTPNVSIYTSTMDPMGMVLTHCSGLRLRNIPPRSLLSLHRGYIWSFLPKIGLRRTDRAYLEMTIDTAIAAIPYWVRTYSLLGAMYKLQLNMIQHWLVVWNMTFMIFHSVGNNHPNWVLFFSEG